MIFKEIFIWLLPNKGNITNWTCRADTIFESKFEDVKFEEAEFEGEFE